MRQIGVDRSTPAGKPGKVGAKRGTDGLAHRLHVEGMLHTGNGRMPLTVLLVLGPIGEMLVRLGEDTSGDAIACFLGSGVVDLFEHTRHAKQIRRFERTEIGQQMLGIRNVSDNAMPADAHILDVTGKAVS